MSAKNGILAFLGGAAVGAIVALLFAPEKGEVTRRKISDAVLDGKDKVIDTVEKGKERVEDAIATGREKIAEAIKAGKQRLEDEIEMAICEEKEVIAKNRRK